jgi:predicted CXXCH cytochrome family protein
MRSRYIAVSIIFLFTASCFSQSVVNTVHNLSASGPGDVHALSESEICIFCHTPHRSKANSPLWNRNDPGVVYDLYQSTTIQSSPGQPDGSSLLCLSCHDGTIAMGNVLSRETDIDFSGGLTYMPDGAYNLSSNLSDDHPVSFEYNSALASADGQLKDPAAISYPVSLMNGKVQCTSCHDPHRNIYSDFLLVSSQFSELCYSCHDRNYWPGSSHSTSTASWNGNGTDPWPHTPYSSVAENACENCHSPHNAAGKYRLLNYLSEEQNCLVCHNGNVAGTDISAQLIKPHAHRVEWYNLAHDPAEDALVSTMHVECEDCHNPHAVTGTGASAPEANGFITGIQGIDQFGSPVNPIQYQYELCFRCHADSPTKPASTTVRMIEQNNVRLEFDINNPSYHPVTGIGANTNSPSLIAPDYDENSIIYCTDCHASDGPSSPAGPHGSMYPGLLKYRYDRADYTVESALSYELCYSCHDRNSILGDNSFGKHNLHIVEQNTPCNACHDPHGISNTQGTITNNSHLINFDLNIVTASGNSVVQFVDTGLFSGYCQLRCHGRGHGIGMSY